jgi:hypothetical protein
MFKTTRFVIGGALLLGTTTLACGSSHEAAPAPKHQLPLVTMPASAETTAATGITTWELYNARRSVGATQAYEVVARSAESSVVRAMKVQMISQKVIKGAGRSTFVSSKPHLLMDGKGVVLESTLTRGAMEANIHLKHDTSARGGAQQYGCQGDILWAIGGFIATFATCSLAVAGAVIGPADALMVVACAGTAVETAGAVISSYEDCTPQPSPQWHAGDDNSEYEVTVAFEEDNTWTGSDGETGDWGDWGGGGGGGWYG